MSAWLNSFLLPCPGVALTMLFKMLRAFAGRIAVQRLRAFLALAFCDALFSQTHLSSSTGSPGLFGCQVLPLPDKPGARHRAAFGFFLTAAGVANFSPGPRQNILELGIRGLEQLPLELLP